MNTQTSMFADETKPDTQLSFDTAVSDPVTTYFEGDIFYVCIDGTWSHHAALTFAGNLRGVSGVKTARAESDNCWSVTFGRATTIESARQQIRQQAARFVEFWSAAPAQASLF